MKATEVEVMKVKTAEIVRLKIDIEKEKFYDPARTGCHGLDIKRNGKRYFLCSGKLKKIGMKVEWCYCNGYGYYASNYDVGAYGLLTKKGGIE